MGAELDIWAAKRDRDTLQPLLLGFALLTSDTYQEVFVKFVNVRRKLGLYVNMAVVTPLLLKYAERVTLWDSNNIFLGNIIDENSLPGLVTSNFSRINSEKLGVLRVQFKDDSFLSFFVPKTHLSEVSFSDPTSIEY